MLAATLPRLLAHRLRSPPARRGWPTWAHYAATAALVLAAYAARLALDGVYHLPFLTFIPVVLAASLLFDRGSGLLATVLSAALASRFLPGPGGGPALGGGDGPVALAAFVVFGLFTAALIEALRAAVDRLVEAERRARASEARTAALLDEMHHRFKNGLQAVGGVLHAQGRRLEDAAARAALEDAAGRLRVLARLHDRLHLRGERAGVGPVEMRGFLDALCADLRSTLAEGRPVAVRACADPICLDASQAVPLGLIVNEAVTNALKHAFPGERRGAVSVRLRHHGDRGLRLEVADDGVGHPEGDAGAAGGGTRLVSALARQLNGHAAWHAARPGTAVVVTFPEASAV